MNVNVQTIKNDWSEIPQGLTWYFIGAPKTGKSTQASKWHKDGSSKVVILDTDLGADFVDGANIIPITSFNPPMRTVLDKDGNPIHERNGTYVYEKQEPIPPIERGYYYRTGADKGKPMETYALTEAIPWLKKNWKSLPYEVIVMDTIDQVNMWIEEIITQEAGVEDISEIGFGKGWSIARKRGLNSIKRLQVFCKKNASDLILVSHAKPSSTTDEKVQLGPELPRGFASALLGKADIIGYTTANKQDNNYYISFLTYDERSVGSRLIPLKQKTLLFDYNVIADTIKNYEKNKENQNASTTKK